MSAPILLADVNGIVLHEDAEPFLPEWVIAGQPASRSKTLSRSADCTSHVVLWECNSGRFRWHYHFDESILVLSGEAFLIQPDGRERRFGAGDYGFFPAGSECEWRVDDHFRKIAVLRETMTRPIGFALKMWKKLSRAVFPAAPAELPVSTAAGSGSPLHPFQGEQTENKEFPKPEARLGSTYRAVR
jgi:uncharacterized cupin superfamily protein